MEMFLKVKVKGVKIKTYCLLGDIMSVFKLKQILRINNKKESI